MNMGLDLIYLRSSRPPAQKTLIRRGTNIVEKLSLVVVPSKPRLTILL